MPTRDKSERYCGPGATRIVPYWNTPATYGYLNWLDPAQEAELLGIDPVSVEYDVNAALGRNPHSVQALKYNIHEGE